MSAPPVQLKKKHRQSFGELTCGQDNLADKKVT